MIIEKMENGVYQSISDGEVLLTITDLGDNTYKAVNKFNEIIGKVIPLDEYRTSITLISNSKADKNGRYRKSSKLAEHNLSWLNYILQEKGFIRKAKPIA